MEFKDVIVTQVKQEGDQGIIEGFAAIMGNVDHQGDRIHLGAFSKTLSEPPDGLPQLLGWQHNLDIPFGRTVSLKEVGRDELPAEILARAPDATGGLKFQAKIAMSSSTNKERLALMKDETEVMKGSSIGFDTIKAEFSVDRSDGAQETHIREIREVRLWEVSVVALGANSAAAVTSAKDKEGNVDDKRTDEEKALDALITTAKGLTPEAIKEFEPAKRHGLGILVLADALEVAVGELKGKEGLSKPTRTRIASAMRILQGLIDAAEAEEEAARHPKKDLDLELRIRTAEQELETTRL
jgi:HK97 family phage prohead protease